MIEYKIQNEAMLSFAKIADDYVMIEAGKKKVKILGIEKFNQIKAYETINDRMFKAFEHEGTAYISFYDEEKLMIIDMKNIDKYKIISSKESF